VTELHPILKNILQQPENPNATPVEKQDPEEARREWKADMAAVDAPAPAMADVRDFKIPGPAGAIQARAYEPRGLADEERPLLIYFHGGGFIRGDIDTHDSICRVLADAADCMVISAAYRLAPEHRFPAAAEDAYPVVEWVGAQASALRVDPTRIAVGGDSAGANVAIAACLQAKTKGSPQVRFQLLLYPVTHLTSGTESKLLFSKGYLLNSMPFYIASYLGPDGDGSNELASPLLAKDLSGLPPALVVTAGYDPLRDEGHEFAKRLEASGVPVEHVCHADMIHGFISLRGLLSEADAALRHSAERLAVAIAKN
jgi:acetyl esterase